MAAPADNRPFRTLGLLNGESELLVKTDFGTSMIAAVDAVLRSRFSALLSFEKQLRFIVHRVHAMLD